MNACGHHHIGHIGILGVDKKGKEWYQIQLGGSANKNAALAKVLGPSLSRDQITDGIEKLLDVYVENQMLMKAFSVPISVLVLRNLRKSLCPKYLKIIVSSKITGW